MESCHAALQGKLLQQLNLYVHVIVLTDAEVRCSQKLTDAWEGIEKKGEGGGGN